MRKPIFKGVIQRPITLVDEYANLTPNLGFTLYGDSNLQSPPVLEITRLDLGSGRSVVNSFQEDRQLATWSREEQDDFFAEGFRRGILARFSNDRRAQQASVIAATNLLLTGMSQTIAENAQGIVEGRSRFGTKEIGGEWFSEVLSLGYNKTASFINDAFSGASQGIIQTGLEGAANALTQFQKINRERPADRFFVISNLLQGATQSILDTAKDHQEFARLWASEASELKDTWEYHRNGMSNPELLMVEPTSYVMSGESGTHEHRHDFSGDFRVVGHWYKDTSTCKEIFHSPSQAIKHGFQFGPPSYRQYQAILDNLTYRKKMDGTWGKNSKGFIGGTPIDLPRELAEKRLQFLESQNLTGRLSDSAKELREIIAADQLDRPVDARLFQPASLQLTPRDHHMQTASLDTLNRRLKRLTKRSEQSNNTEPQRQFETLRLNETAYYRENHRDAQPSDEHKAAQRGAALAAKLHSGTNWQDAASRFEDELDSGTTIKAATKALDAPDAPVNTRLELAYTSASMKAYETVIVPGAVTQQQINKITSGLFDGEQIIAEQVGLPTPLSIELEAQKADPEPEDHVFTNLADWADSEPLAEALHTHEEPTHTVDIEALANHIGQIGQNGWNIADETERLGIPDDDPSDSPYL